MWQGEARGGWLLQSFLAAAYRSPLVCFGAALFFFFNYKSAINVTRQTMRKSVRSRSGGGAGQDSPGKVVKAFVELSFLCAGPPPLPRGFAPLSRVAHEAFNKHQVRMRPDEDEQETEHWSVLLLSRCSLF